jgi:myo-inositol 2-dehydrogenase/D-chiro-inositol 1-dehydrogenase
VDLRVGVIGTGNIGTSHALSLHGEVSGATVVGVYDVDADRADAVAQEVQADVYPSAEDLIRAAEVDAVVIASPDDLHAEQALTCLAAGKPMLLEKPLAPTVADARRVLDAEVSLGRRLITLGFMRRFDPGYVQLKEQITTGEVGEVLIVHNVHRNASAPYGLLSDRTMYNMVIHEFDISRWLIDEEFVAVQVIKGRPGPQTPPGQFDPMIVMLTSANGTLVDIEAFVNAHYGYEVTCQVVGSLGVLDMSDGSFITRTARNMRGQAIPDLWLGRFAEAYRAELQAWVNATRGVSGPVGASAWDGFAATAMAEAAASSITSGTRESIDLPARPALYS